MNATQISAAFCQNFNFYIFHTNYTQNFINTSHGHFSFMHTRNTWKFVLLVILFIIELIAFTWHHRNLIISSKFLISDWIFRITDNTNQTHFLASSLSLRFLSHSKILCPSMKMTIDCKTRSHMPEKYEVMSFSCVLICSSHITSAFSFFLRSLSMWKPDDAQTLWNYYESGIWEK